MFLTSSKSFKYELQWCVSSSRRTEFIRVKATLFIIRNWHISYRHHGCPATLFLTLFISLLCSDNEFGWGDVSSNVCYVPGNKVYLVRIVFSRWLLGIWRSIKKILEAIIPSNLNLTIGKTSGYDNKTLINNIDLKIGSNTNTNKAKVSHQKSTRSWSPSIPPAAHATPEMQSMKTLDKSLKDAVTIILEGNQKMLAEKHNDEKLAFTLSTVGIGLIA